MCIQSWTCSFDTLEDAKKPQDGFFFTISVSAPNVALLSEELSSMLPDFLRGFLHRRQSWPSNLVRARTTVLFVSDLRHGFPRLVHD